MLTLRRLCKAENYFTTIDVYEQQPTVGGLWNCTSKDKDGTTQSRPIGGHNHWEPQSAMARFVSPMYDGLTTNIPHEIMQFSRYPFPQDTQVLARHEQVLAYIQHYGKDLSSIV